MQVSLDCPYEFRLELRTQPDASGVLLYQESVDLADLVEETFTRGVLAGELPGAPRWLHGRLVPSASPQASAGRVRVELEAHTEDGVATHYAQGYETGRWARRSLARIHQLREEGTLEGGDVAYPRLVADPSAASTVTPCFEAPPVIDGTLEELGVRELGDEALVADRPVLVNDRMVNEILRWTQDAGVAEIGGGTLGKLVRLPEPLPGASTPVVTVLTAAIFDDRHDGVAGSVTFSPEALVEAREVSRMRGRGESVLTVFHSHGWGTGCDRCNENADCGVPEVAVSLRDYEVMETLFSSKATLMPIAGRKLGAPGRRPVLEIFAWRGGSLRPVRWRRYHD